MSWLAYTLLLFGLSWAGVGIFRSYAEAKGFIDKPNERSSHIAVTARGGGIVFTNLWLLLLGALTYLGYLKMFYLPIFLPALLIMLVGFWDDKKGLSATTRLLCQVLAAGISLYFIDMPPIEWVPGVVLPGWAQVVGLVLTIVWMTNLVNFADGTDGLAATGAIFVFGVGGYLLYISQAFGLALLAYGMVALLAGFLVWNWPCASIFMGDTGSSFLGFIIALFALVSYKWFHIPLETWLLLSALFWFDTTLTILRRLMHKERIWEAHSKHAYQRLAQYGWSHLQVLLGSITVNFFLAGLALWGYWEPELNHILLTLASCLLFVLYVLIEIAKPMYKTWHI